ncbi:hypothetical protein L0244_34300, partial [bacterium]|nr:hypothetical protein [bacterium]
MPIRDQHKYKKLEKQLIQLETLRGLEPFLALFGPQGLQAANAIDRILTNELPVFKKQLERLRNLPDKFNEVFGKVGWIAFDDMSVDTIEKALKIENENGLEMAEQFLEEYHNDTLEFFLKRFWVLPLIKPRRQLIALAFEDHNAKRYHASISVILAQIDGICYDLVKKSFYETSKKKTRHLQAIETIAGDPSGLAQLATLLSSSYTMTKNNPTNLPYRHGILHGRDLGFATSRNSTKAFVYLLALRTWMHKVERGEQFTLPRDDD